MCTSSQEGWRKRQTVANLRSFLDSAARNTVAYMVWSGWFEPYLHSTQSPYKNDDLYLVWLDMVLEDKEIDDGGMLEHLEQMRAVLEKNKIGSTLEDVVLNFFAISGYNCFVI